LNFNFEILIFIFVVIFSGCNSEKKVTTNINDKTFDLQTVENKTISISVKSGIWSVKGYEDKVILLDFFTTWCPPCKAEIPHLNHLYKNYKNKFEIIGILLENSKLNIEMRPFIKEYKIKYPITNDSDNRRLADTIGNVRSIPAMFIINLDGKIVQHYVGIVPEEMIASDIKRALRK
jgi:thiol-disulfide isomerase/thioredoxin